MSSDSDTEDVERSSLILRVLRNVHGVVNYVLPQGGEVTVASSDEIERAMDIGRGNAEMISLGKAWCTNIRTDRTGMGVGMVEQMTGLPITGGRFTCDFARAPDGLSGMELSASAVGFYEHNCRGCPHRSPGNRVPNLSTWAEPILSERERLAEVAAEEARVTAAESDARIAHRQMVGAGLNAASQEVIALINRLDKDPRDLEAAEELRAAAQLTPDTFGKEIQEVAIADARSLQSAALLEALVVLHTEGGILDPDALHSLCVDGVRQGWGRDAGARLLEE